ncbi:MAG: 30S ribosomal protein S8 [Patescibacteria group bacterium]|jgi:small subunit ribosomal protein S8
MVDPIADMLTQIRNAQAVKKSEISLPFSKVKLALAKILKEEGYIVDFAILEKNKFLKIVLKYLENGQPIIQKIERKSTPGQRIYVGSKEIKKILGGLGTSIVSTSMGIMTGKAARKRNLGGELICEIF